MAARKSRNGCCKTSSARQHEVDIRMRDQASRPIEHKCFAVCPTRISEMNRKLQIDVSNLQPSAKRLPVTAMVRTVRSQPGRSRDQPDICEHAPDTAA